MNYKNMNDYELLYLISENDEFAREILINKYKPIVHFIANKYYKVNKSKGVELQDLIQEGYYALLKSTETYQPIKNNLFYTYTSVCIERTIQAFCRKLNTKKYEILNQSFSYEVCEPNSNQQYKNIISDTKEDEPFTKILIEDFYQELNQLRLDLDTEYSEIFELRYNGFSYKEISILLDIKVSRVGKCLESVRKELRKRGLQTFLNKY